MKIFIVDDEPKARKGIHKLLMTRDHWEIEGVFSSASELLVDLSERKVDVLITDIKMPEMDGLELIERILEKDPNIAIVIISGYSNFEFAQKAIELGVRRYLTKPIRPKELFDILETIEEELPKTCLEVKNNVGKKVIHEACLYIELHYHEKLTLNDIAKELYISPNYLSTLFKKEKQINISDYILNFRIKQAKKLLIQTNYRISEIAEMIGFTDARYFSSTFKKNVNKTPQEYRNHNL